jgi:hypothetical protein
MTRIPAGQDHHAHVPGGGVGLGEQRVDQRLPAGQLEPQHPGVGHHLKQTLPAGPVHARERLFPEVAVLAVVVATEVHLVAGTGVPVGSLRPDQDRFIDQTAGQIGAPPGSDRASEPRGNRGIGRCVAQFGVSGGPDPDRSVVAGPDDDVSLWIGTPVS